MKKTLRRAFKNVNSPTFHKTNNFFAILTIVSIASLVLETVPALVEYQNVFLVIEWVSVILFAGEYIARTYVSSPSWKYTTSFFGIVDLVAILPTFLGLGNFVFLKSVRALRIVRLLRMLRLAKLSRIAAADDHDISPSSLSVMIYLSTLIIALLVTGTAMYLVEPTLDAFQSIPAGMWWSLKVFMGGISVVQPLTDLGEFFYVLTRFTGLLMLGLLIGVVGNLFKGFLMGREYG